MNNLLITNIGELVTLAPLAAKAQLTPVQSDDLGIVKDAWLAIKDGKIANFGSGKPDALYASWPHFDARRRLVMPGLVDSHAHPLFAGSRARELSMRLNGMTYAEIAAQGGGIQYTVQSTREASDDTLLASLAERLERFLSLGITTLEAKSGYGLSVAEELRHLRILNEGRRRSPQHIEITCLALHAKSPDFPDLRSYVAAVTQELLPVVAEEKLATAVDAFVETGYFSTEDVAPYLAKAKELGLAIRLHADEFSDAGAAKAAAEWGALSADHLQHASSTSMAKMAGAGVIATILPGTSLYTAIPFTKARPFIEAGVNVAIATDFNPGSCYIDNLPMLATLAALHCGLKPHEAIAGVTYVPACSLGLSQSKGALSPGFDADLLHYDRLDSAEEWLYDFGRTKPAKVWIQGRQVIAAHAAG